LVQLSPPGKVFYRQKFLATPPRRYRSAWNDWNDWNACSVVSTSDDAPEPREASSFRLSLHPTAAGPASGGHRRAATGFLRQAWPAVIEIPMNRLTRLDVVFTEAPIYFITACTDNRRHLLAKDDVHEVFRRFCTQARLRGVLVGRYVLMPDHLHLFACIPPGAVGLSMWMKSLKNALSKHWREHGIEAPHWQKGFFDHLIRAGESHAQKWRYVRENPVRAGLVGAAEDWPFAGVIQPDSWT
jgi:REP element-mobilizing transposase RayT